MNGNTETKCTKEAESKINLEERDKSDSWDEVMQLAEQYGFIRFAYGGFAMLSIDEAVMKGK